MTLASERDWQRLERAVAILNHKVETAYLMTGCPRCGQPIGRRCTRAGVQSNGVPLSQRPPLKHSHVQRLTRAGIYLR